MRLHSLNFISCSLNLFGNSYDHILCICMCKFHMIFELCYCAEFYMIFVVSYSYPVTLGSFVTDMFILRYFRLGCYWYVYSVICLFCDISIFFSEHGSINMYFLFRLGFDWYSYSVIFRYYFSLARFYRYVL